jgi:hypothetical protein
MNLNATDTLELVTSATATIDVLVSFRDDGSNPSPVRSQATAITTAATTTICDAPSAATSRTIESITVRNKGATTCTVTVQTNGTSTVENYEATILADGGLTWTSGAGWVATTVSAIGVPNVVVLAADVANSGNNAAADVTGLGFTVEADLTYEASWVIPFTAAATTTGSRWMVNGPANPTTLSGTGSWPVTATTRTLSNFTAYDIPAAASTDSLTTGNVALLTCTITPSVAGTVIARFASEVNASAITALAGATLTWKRVL